MFEDADELLSAIRSVHNAGTVAGIVRELVRGASLDAPQTMTEWNARHLVAAGIQAELERLKLSHAQNHAASAEQAQEYRKDARRNVQSMLASLVPTGERDGRRERLEQLAQAAVSAIAGKRRSGDTLRTAALDATDKPVAFASLGGGMFIPASARMFAEERGLRENEVASAVAKAAQPLRAACRTREVCRVGQLRFSHRPASGGVIMRASIDLSTEDEHGPVIRIRFLDASLPVEDSPQSGASSPDEARRGYGARVLRRLVS